MRLRRAALLGTVAVVAVAVGAGLIVSHNQTNRGKSLEAPRTNTGSPKLQLTSIKSKLTSPTTFTWPNQFACIKTLCLLATTNQSGSVSRLWARQAGRINFTPLPPLTGSATFVSGLSCQSSNTCYLLARQGSNEVGAQILVTNDAGRSWNPLSLGAQFSPTSVGCLPDSSCWVTGTSNGRPEVLVTPYLPGQLQPTRWTPITLAGEPSGASNQISCATTSNCVDSVGLPAAMARSNEALRGNLIAGFTTILSAAEVGPEDQASCDLVDCYFYQKFAPGAEDQIHITSISDNGAITTLATTTKANTFINQLSCSSTQCMVDAQTNKSESKFWALGRGLTPVRVPNGLSADSPSLDCENTSPVCLLTLYRPVPGPAANYLTQLHAANLQLGSPTQLSTMAAATSEPFSTNLVSCTQRSCFEPVETTSGIELLTFDPGRDRVVSSFRIRDASAGTGLLTPVAMTCPSVSNCKLIVQVGNGRYQLLSLNPINRQTTVNNTLPRSNAPSSIACTSSKDCIVTISGISHHHGFPAIWTTDAGKSWNSAHAINATNDLSSAEVSCQAGGGCIVIGQHDFVDGYGTLRPFIAYSHDNGSVWRLVRFTGRVPYSLTEPVLFSVACPRTGSCSGVVATSTATLLLQGGVGMNPWTVQAIQLHQVGQNTNPLSASIACGSIHCLLSLTINPAGNNSKLSVQSLVIGPGRQVGPIISGQLPSSGDLSAAFGSHHSYLDTSPSATTWVRLNPT